MDTKLAVLCGPEKLSLQSENLLKMMWERYRSGKLVAEILHWLVKLVIIGLIQEFSRIFLLTSLGCSSSPQG